MVFDAVNFAIRGVKWNGKKAVYEYKNGKLKITPKQPVKQGSREVARLIVRNPAKSPPVQVRR